MNEPTSTSDVALFVDWENLKRSLSKTGREPNVSSLRDTAEQFGRVVVANAYADWQDPWHQDDPFRLYAAGIQPVYVPTVVRHGEGGSNSPFTRRRNSVDVKLATECMECCFKYENIDTFVLVSGDGDFVHLVNMLRPYGKTVVAVGVSWSTSVQLAESVDRLLYYDRDIEPVEAPADLTRGKSRSAEDEDALQRAFERVIEIIRSSQRGDRALLSWIKHELIKRYGSFDERRYGFPQFKAFMREAEARGLLKIVEVDLVNWAYLPEAAEAGAAEERPLRAESRPAAPGEAVAAEARMRLIQFAHAMETRYPYISFTFLLDRIMEAELFPYTREELAGLLNDAVEDMIFLHSSVQDNRSGQVRTVRTITLNHNHPEVAQTLGEVPPKQPAPAETASRPSLSKPGGDSRLAADLKALSSDPHNHELECRVAERLSQLGRYNDAVEHLRRAVTLAPRQPAYRAALVRCLIAAQQNEEALIACRRAVEEFETEADLHHLLGQLLAGRGEHEEAIGAYRRAVGLVAGGAGADERVYLSLAETYRRLGQMKNALGVLQEGLSRLPESQALTDEVSRLQEEMRRAEAEQLGRRAAALAGEAGAEEDALALAREALALSDQAFQPHAALGEIYARRGELDKAAESFEKAIARAPNPGDAYALRMRLVDLYERMGRPDAAQAMRIMLS
jgi:tetratricopeptide (TPR) repeat protein